MAAFVLNRNGCLSRMTGSERRLSERLEHKLEDDHPSRYDVAIGCSSAIRTASCCSRAAVLAS
ncbi:MAG: hypothetical protein EPN34_12570 [Burkholderiaceae bacterium]|nr:MAG: hypothetical protein EPN34_12570 [Burkholderiaceae bacterium]